MQHSFFVHFFAFVLHDFNVTWNFLKLPGLLVIRFMEKCRVCSLSLFFFTVAHFHPSGRYHFSFSHCRYKISRCSSNKKCLLCFFSLALALFLVELGWPVALLSVLLCLSLSLYSKFVDMTINLSLVLYKTTRVQKHFLLSVFVFIDSLVVSASQEAGGHTLSS